MMQMNFTFFRYASIATGCLTTIFIVVAINTHWFEATYNLPGIQQSYYKNRTLKFSIYLYKTCKEMSECDGDTSDPLCYRKTICSPRSEVLNFKIMSKDGEEIPLAHLYVDLDVTILSLMMSLLFCLLALVTNVMIVHMKRYKRKVYLQHVLYSSLAVDALLFTVIWFNTNLQSDLDERSKNMTTIKTRSSFTTGYYATYVAIIISFVTVCFAVLSIWKRPRDDFDYNIMMNNNGEEMDASA